MYALIKRALLIFPFFASKTLQNFANPYIMSSSISSDKIVKGSFINVYVPLTIASHP